MTLCRSGNACDGRLGSRNYAKMSAMMKHGMAWHWQGMAWQNMRAISYVMYS